MSDAEYYPEEEEATSPGLPERKPKFDKWMAISWGISLASAALILALATVIVLFVKHDEEEAPGFALAVDMQLDQEEIQKKVQQKKLEKSSSSASSRSPIVAMTNLSDIDVSDMNFTVGLDKGVADVGVTGNVGNMSLGLDMGAMNMASFFGMKAKGNRFAFLIDYSGSMKEDQLKVMKNELIKTLNTFNSNVQVSLIFFSGPAFIAGEDPNQIRANWENPGGGFSNYVPKKGWKPPVPKWLACTKSTKSRLKGHILETPKTGGTDWRNPFNMAYTMNPRPQVIFFMTDGATRNPEETVEKVKKNRTIQVNSIAFGIGSPQAEAPMKEMAKVTRGTFKAYTKPEIAKMAAKL
jgi:hypothetical protein